IRLQRAVIQQWKQDVPWAKAGQVTVANGADIAKEAGLFPAEATRPETPGGADVAAAPPTAGPAGSAPSAAASAAPPRAGPAGSAPSAPGAPPAAAAQTSSAPTSAAAGQAAAPSAGAQAALDRVNYYRALMGLPPLRLDAALAQAAGAHAAYYRQNGAG